MAHPTNSHKSHQAQPTFKPPSAIAHQQGISSNQVPMGRSARLRRRYGRDQGGQKRSTQFRSVASRTLPSSAASLL